MDGPQLAVAPEQLPLDAGIRDDWAVSSFGLSASDGGLVCGSRMIPNRTTTPLDPVERLAESGDLRRLREAAWATGNRALAAVLDELERQLCRRRGKHRTPSK